MTEPRMGLLCLGFPDNVILLLSHCSGPIMAIFPPHFLPDCSEPWIDPISLPHKMQPDSDSWLLGRKEGHLHRGELHFDCHQGSNSQSLCHISTSVPFPCHP